VPWVASSFVNGAGVPPEAATLKRGPSIVWGKTMTPPRLHVPPLALAASQRTRGGPPSASTLFSFPSAKNPRLLLSGDQNGYVAPSVPASGRETVESRLRTWRPIVPSSCLAEKAIRRPSGETATGPAPGPLRRKPACSGGRIEARTARSSTRAERR
jgi:hypothetical protein